MSSLKTSLIRLGAAFIPVKSVRRRIRRRLLDRARDERVAALVPVVRARYADHAARCRAKIERGEPLKVCFLICDASMFSGESVFQLMRGDARFAPVVAVAPRVTRGEEFLRETLAKTVGRLDAKYPGFVRSLYDPDSGKASAIDADIVFSTVLYEDQTLPDYTVENLSKRSLTAILYYGYGGLFISNEYKTPYLPNVVLAWKYFVSNGATRDLGVARNPLLAANVEVAGYCKMDRLEPLLAKRRGSAVSGRRKKVIVSPHHTIDVATDALALSTFIKNADALLELPSRFPEIDFVFRPHPLLFPRLATAKWWGSERTAAYRARMEAYSNVEFQQGGDYFDSFADSDALIHDCGSFLAEYFYTGKPQCFMLNDDSTVDTQFLPFGRKLLAHAFRAYDGAGIERFIRDVVIGGNDPNRAARADFARREVCVNHPSSSAAVIASILGSLPPA